MTTDPDAAAPPRALVIAASVIALALVIGVAVIGLTSGTSGDDPSAPPPRPLALPSVDTPDAGSKQCVRLAKRLPDSLPGTEADLARRELTDPAPEGAAAWGDGAIAPVVLRCGLPKPQALRPTSRLQVVDDVQWLVVSGAGSATWYAVDRPVYLALTIDTADTVGTGPLQRLSKLIAATLRPIKVRP